MIQRVILLTVACVVIDAEVRASEQPVISLTDQTQQQCLRVLRSGLLADDFWPSIHAAEGLTLAGHGDEVIETLTARLANETDDQRRCGIARELVRAGDRQQVRVLLQILSADDEYGHVHAAESLYKVAEIGDGTALRRVFAESHNPTLKLMAAAALGRGGSPQAMAYLRVMLNDVDPKLFRIAAWVLGRIGDESDIPRIARHRSRCPDDLTLAYLNNSLAGLGSASGLESLVGSLSSEDPAIRTCAATFAGDARADTAVEQLKRTLDDPHPDARIRAAQSLLWMSRPAPLSQRQDISKIVFASTPQNPRYTEGSIIALHDGSLLFAVTEFQDSDSDFARARIVARQSADSGRTWDEPRVLQENTGGLNVMSVTLRRVGPDRIGLFYLQKNSFNDLDLLVRFSSDETRTFGPPILVTGDPGYHVVNNDRITQLSSGRLLAPAASTPDVKQDNHFISHCYLSDDGGMSWRAGQGHVDADRRGAMEPEVIELKDGRTMMIVRTQLGIIGRSFSSDGGDTWTKMESLGVQAPEAPATLRRVPSTGDLLLIWNNTWVEGAGHGGRRTPLTAALSRDEGRTWQIAGDLESDPEKTFSYTSLTFIGSRAVMSYWETAKSGGYSCRFRSLQVAWFYESTHR